MDFLEIFFRGLRGLFGASREEDGPFENAQNLVALVIILLIVILLPFAVIAWLMYE